MARWGDLCRQLTGRIVASAVVVLSIGLAAPSVAAQELSYSPAPTETCLQDLARGADRGQCIGVAAEVCRQASDRETAASQCLVRELAYWQARMRAALGMAISRAESKDFDARAMNIPPRHQEAALIILQDNWTIYRDSACAFEQTLWGRGDPTGGQNLSCQMYLIAEQTFYLEAVALIDR